LGMVTLSIAHSGLLSARISMRYLLRYLTS
jgi:hypothetical protein